MGVLTIERELGAVADGEEIGKRLREGDLSAAPEALNLIESCGLLQQDEIARLQAEVSPDALGGEAGAHIIGITGPPGAGKSSLLSELVAGWRKQERSVAVLAVDPSSRRSGGALLGDRARIVAPTSDDGVFIRSTASAGRLGGLAPATNTAAQALAAAFDVVVIETVGVGQSETAVADTVDTVAVVAQPGAGDVLQFLKAGIMEIPDVLTVTKADLGLPAQRTVRDLRAALQALGSGQTAVVAVSSLPPAQGVDELIEALDQHLVSIDLPSRRLNARRNSALTQFAAEYGERGIRALGGRRTGGRWLADQPAGLDVPTLFKLLEQHAQDDD